MAKVSRTTKKEPVFETVTLGPLIKKTENSAVRMSIVSIDGTEMMDFRQFYRTRDSKEWLPTGKGFTLPLEATVKATIKWRKFAKAELETI